MAASKHSKAAPRKTSKRFKALSVRELATMYESGKPLSRAQRERVETWILRHVKPTQRAMLARIGATLELEKERPIVPEVVPPPPREITAADVESARQRLNDASSEAHSLCLTFEAVDGVTGNIAMSNCRAEDHHIEALQALADCGERRLRAIAEMIREAAHIIDPSRPAPATASVAGGAA